LLVTFPNKRSFGMDLFTRALRLLHKHVTKTILFTSSSSKTISVVWLLLVSMILEFLVRSRRNRCQTATSFRHKG